MSDDSTHPPDFDGLPFLRCRVVFKTFFELLNFLSPHFPLINRQSEASARGWCGPTVPAPAAPRLPADGSVALRARNGEEKARARTSFPRSNNFFPRWILQYSPGRPLEWQKQALPRGKNGQASTKAFLTSAPTAASLCSASGGSGSGGWAAARVFCMMRRMTI